MAFSVAYSQSYFSTTTSNTNSSVNISHLGSITLGSIYGSISDPFRDLEGRFLDVYNSSGNVSFRVGNNSGKFNISVAGANGAFFPSAETGNIILRKQTTNKVIFSLNNTANDGNHSFVFGDDVNQNTLNILNNGRIGIGTSNPQHNLDIKTGGGYLRTFTNGTEYVVNTTGGWARSFKFTNDSDNEQTTSFGSINGTAFISSGFNNSSDPTGYNNRKFVLTPSGNVGIGTVSPQETLHVNGSIRGNIGTGALRVKSSTGYLDLGAQNSSWAHIYTDRPAVIFNKDIYTTTNSFSSYTGDLLLKAQGSEKFRIKSSNGYVGIGTTNPAAKLHVFNGDNSYGAILANADEASFSLYTKSISTQPVNIESFRLGLKYGTDENNGFISFYRGGGTSGGFLGFSTNGIERIRVDNNGNVGIGTSNPDSELTVKGKIHTQEVNIDLNGAVAPDYVFLEDYNLRTLDEVSYYINKNGHLPNIPSAKKMEEEGVNLKEMTLKLLEKIEELTLYTIEQEKRIKQLEKKLNENEKK